MKEQDPYEHLRKCQLNQDHSDYKETFSVAANTTIRVMLNLTTRSGFLARGFVLLVDPYTGHLMQKDRLAEGHDFKGAIKREILIPLPCGEEKQGDVIAKYVKQAATRLISENTDRLGSMRREHRELAEITLRQELAIYMDDFLLDELCWKNTGDPKWLAMVLVKEGGLSAAAVRELRIGDLILCENDPERVFIHLLREDLHTATTDDTFPLSPFGALYVHAYLNEIKDDQVDAERYLVSADKTGAVPMSVTDITSFIREKCAMELFGYKGVIRTDDQKSISMGIPLLQNTRQEHLRSNHYFSGDIGAITFMMHQSMQNQVQSDHYRCFTDETGMECMYQRIRHDRHGCPKMPKEYHRMSRCAEGERVTYRIPGNGIDGGEELVTFVVHGAKPGDMIQMSAKSGILINSVDNN